MQQQPVLKIISGGQNGVDQGGLDAALALGIPHGGTCPRGRRSESGTIPAKYDLIESTSTSYPPRTLQNVLDSDGTLLVHKVPLYGGSKYTYELCMRYNKPVYCIRLYNAEIKTWLLEPILFREWLKKMRIQTLNVAGSRESSMPGVQSYVEYFLRHVFSGKV